MATDEEPPWEGRCLHEAYTFASRCAALSESNPYDRPALDEIMSDLATELWDRSFSQTEIKAAFERALAGLSHYAAGEERRGKQPRR